MPALPPGMPGPSISETPVFDRPRERSVVRIDVRRAELYLDLRYRFPGDDVCEVTVHEIRHSSPTHGSPNGQVPSGRTRTGLFSESTATPGRSARYCSWPCQLRSCCSPRDRQNPRRRLGGIDCDRTAHPTAADGCLRLDTEAHEEPCSHVGRVVSTGNGLLFSSSGYSAHSAMLDDALLTFLPSACAFPPKAGSLARVSASA